MRMPVLALCRSVAAQAGRLQTVFAVSVLKHSIEQERDHSATRQPEEFPASVERQPALAAVTDCINSECVIIHRAQLIYQ